MKISNCIITKVGISCLYEPVNNIPLYITGYLFLRVGEIISMNIYKNLDNYSNYLNNFTNHDQIDFT
jgi:hypothetical protein